MTGFEHHSDYSLVTAILPRHSTGKVLEEVLSSGAAHALTLNARGTLVKEHWYQSVLPTLSPEREIINFLVPNSETDHLMEQVVMAGNLRHYGAGSIFATECLNLTCAADYPLWKPGNYTYESTSFDIHFKDNLFELTLVTDRDNAEGICRAAIKAGAHGPTISYTKGYGLRDRLGLLRITKKHDKELITLVLDSYDVDAVFQVMAEAGNVDRPGRGLIYQTQITKGLTNLASVFQPKRHSASVQQMIRAIDELQGNTDWRANQLLIHDPKAEEFAEDTQGLAKDLSVLNVICQRKDAEALLFSALEFGVSGASVSNWRFAEKNAEQTRGGLRINREVGRVNFILRPESVEPLKEHLSEIVAERGMKQTCFFTHAVPVLKTFASSPLVQTV